VGLQPQRLLSDLGRDQRAGQCQATGRIRLAGVLLMAQAKAVAGGREQMRGVAPPAGGGQHHGDAFGVAGPQQPRRKQGFALHNDAPQATQADPVLLAVRIAQFHHARAMQAGLGATAVDQQGHRGHHASQGQSKACAASCP
jgi:hypothetical protein